jgi:hypothetical protein
MTTSRLNGRSAEALTVWLSLTQVSMRKLCGHNVPPADC